MIATGLPEQNGRRGAVRSILDPGQASRDSENRDDSPNAPRAALIEAPG